MASPASLERAPLLRLSPARAVWAVAWPMVAVGLLKSSYFVVDSYFVGRLGDDALAALGGAAFAWWMTLLVCEVAGTGTHALVARAEGAGQRDRVPGLVVQGVWLGAAASVLLIAATPARGIYFDLLGLSYGTAEHELGTAYLHACLLGAGTFAAHSVLGAAFRGLGDTRTALAITVVTVAANAALDPVLIWGFGPIPALGIAGAAWATAIANGIGAVLGWWALRRRGLHLTPAMPDPLVIRTCFRIGAPVSGRGIAFSAVYVVLGRFITDFGVFQMAALGLGHRLEGFAFMVCMGFGVGASTMVGQYLGAGDTRGARRSAHIAAGLCVLATLPFSVLGWVFAEPLFDLFANEPETVAAGVVYLRIQVWVFAFMSLESVYEGAFTGTGDTVAAFWIGGGGTFARIPIAWVLAWPLGLGVEGIWYAIALTTVVKGVVLLGWFTAGWWSAEAGAVPTP